MFSWILLFQVKFDTFIPILIIWTKNIFIWTKKFSIDSGSAQLTKWVQVQKEFITAKKISLALSQCHVMTCVLYSSAIFSYSLGPLGSSNKVTNFFDQVLLLSYLLWTSPCLYPLQIQVCESVWIRNLNSCGHFDLHLCHIYQTGGGRGYLKELQSIYMYRLIRYR